MNCENALGNFPPYTHLFPFFIHLSECKYTYIYIFLFIQFVSFIVNVVSTRCLFIFRFPCKRDFYLIPLHYITYTHAPHKLLSGFFLSFGNKIFFVLCAKYIINSMESIRVTSHRCICQITLLQAQ